MPRAGDDPAAVDRVLALALGPQADQLVGALQLGELEPRGEPHRRQRLLAAALQLPAQLLQLAPLGRPVEAADADVDRVHRAAADDLDQPVAGLLRPQPAFDHVGVLGGHREAGLVAEEVGRVQQVEVQRVALDPLAAVDQAAQRPQLPLDLDPQRVLHRLAGAGLVGDRADAADPGGDVGGLLEAAAAQQRLEEARRLVDPQLDVEHLLAAQAHVHRALALDPGQGVGLDPPLAHPSTPRRGRALFRIASKTSATFIWRPRLRPRGTLGRRR